MLLNPVHEVRNIQSLQRRPDTILSELLAKINWDEPKLAYVIRQYTVEVGHMIVFNNVL